MAHKPVLGLIGGVGSGKSTVARTLAEMDGLVIDADQIGHETLRRPEIRDQVAARWGPEILLESDGEVDRRKLAAIVFRDRNELTQLERIMHPVMKDEIRHRIAAAQARQDVQLVALDAAILLEAGWDDLCDRVVFIDSPRSQRLARVRAARSWGERELDARERSQISLAEKRRRADDVLDNSGGPEQVRGQVASLIETFAKKVASDP